MYHRNVDGGLVYDDLATLADPAVTSGKWWKLKQGMRWLTRATYAINFKLTKQIIEDQKQVQAALGALRTRWFHITNIAIHSINTIITAAILQALGYHPLMGALFFFVTPIAVNSVANIAGRYGLLSYTFASAALLSAITGLHFLVPLFLYLTYISKEDGLAILPLIIALLGWQHHFVYAGLYIVGAAIGFRLSWAHVKWRFNSPSTVNITGWPPALSGWAWRRTFVVESLKRWPKWFLGFGYNFSPDVEEVSWSDFIRYLVATLIVALAIVVFPIPILQLGLLMWAVSPWWAYLVTPMPDVILEHRGYQSSLGLSVLVAGFAALMPAWLVVGWLVSLACTTRERAGMWKPIRLFEAAIEDGSTKPMVLLNLSSMYIAKGRLQEAREMVERALKVAPNVYHAYGNLGTIYAMIGDGVAMNKAYRKGAFLCPKLPMAWTVLGHVYTGQKRWGRAMAAYRHASRLAPGDVELQEKMKEIAPRLKKRYNNPTRFIKGGIL